MYKKGRAISDPAFPSISNNQLRLSIENDSYECARTDVKLPFYIDTTGALGIIYGDVGVTESIFRVGDDPRAGGYLTASCRRRLLSSRAIRVPYATFARRRIVPRRYVQLSVSMALKIGFSVTIAPVVLSLS